MKTDEYRRNFELEQDYWWFVGVRRMVHMLLRLAGAAPPYGKVLDVGCGSGALLDELAASRAEVWGMDVSPLALDFCRLRGHERLVLGDATKLPFKDGEFDVVTAIGVIEHLDDDATFVSEISRVLKPQGVLVLLTSSFPFLWSAHDVANEHRRRYYLRPLRKMIESKGFRTVRISHFNFLLFPALAVVLLTHRVWRGLKTTTAQRILPVPPAPVNGFLKIVLAVETELVKVTTLPWGVSIIGAFRKAD